MKFNLFYYENYAIDTPFNDSNPRYVLSLNGINEILASIISNEPFTCKVSDFNEELVAKLLDVDVLKLVKGKLAMSIPFFVEDDFDCLKRLSQNVAYRIASNLLAHKDHLYEICRTVHNGFSVQRNLYHLLCGTIFDGMLFDFLEENDLITTSFVHKSGLDYLVILYEDANRLTRYSNELLCSYNRLVVDGKGFVSFGDSNGNRQDFYRYMRLKELDLLNEQQRKYMNCTTQEFIANFKKLLDNQVIEDKYVEIFEYFGYVFNGKISVPIFDHFSKQVATTLYEYILPLIKCELTGALQIIAQTSLVANQHHIKTKDIANEIYHLIFGEVNELLVSGGIVATPIYKENEGRYFKSFEYCGEII